MGGPRNPLAVYLLALTTASGIVTLSGLTTSGAIAESLPGWPARTWGALLTFGGGAMLLGMFWPGLVTSGLLLKRIGSFVLMVATAVFAVAIITVAGWGGAYTSGIVAGFSVACGAYYRTVNRRVRYIIAATAEGTTVEVLP